MIHFIFSILCQVEKYFRLERDRDFLFKKIFADHFCQVILFNPIIDSRMFSDEFSDSSNLTTH